MHRIIMNSAAYRQSSAANDAGILADSGARMLWRFPTRRLEAEPLRDTILAVSGVLDLTMGGPGFDLFVPNDNYVKVYQSKQEFGPDTFRRMVYQSKPRVQLDDTFGAFDVPDAGQIAPRRTSSTTPLQALNFLNSTFAMQQSELLAARLEKEAGKEPDAQVKRAFQLAYPARAQCGRTGGLRTTHFTARAGDVLPRAVQHERVHDPVLILLCKTIFYPVGTFSIKASAGWAASL